ncbi:Fur family zinc uptake transcriptional regulator [Alteromonadaceae bacterium 2753L.S.0a.02]|nr:Fur family zinc uptake transcriptional regulator [Alteromonadaceae bacterium 2753L.S.0a.02]
MRKAELNKILTRAAQQCGVAGVRLTDKRKRILELLVAQEKPLSAYQVADTYNEDSDSTMPPMSVYRILDFLVAEQLVHKLHSTNKYVACSHIACDHPHYAPQFLICRECSAVKEVAAPQELWESLNSQAKDAGFQLLNTPLELDCICDRCSNSR